MFQALLCFVFLFSKLSKLCVHCRVCSHLIYLPVLLAADVQGDPRDYPVSIIIVKIWILLLLIFSYPWNSHSLLSEPKLTSLSNLCFSLCSKPFFFFTFQSFFLEKRNLTYKQQNFNVKRILISVALYLMLESLEID